MNCHDTQTVWDDVRDGAASPQQREALDEHLRCCGKCRSLWKAEEAWLDELSRPVPQSNEARRKFALRTVTEWEAGSRPGILARIGVPLLAAAAVVALVATITFRMIGTSQTPIIAVNPPPQLVNPVQHPTPRPQFNSDSIALVANQFEKVYYEKPAKMIGGIRKTIEQVDIKKLPDLLNRAWSENARAGAATRPADRASELSPHAAGDVETNHDADATGVARTQPAAAVRP